MTLRPRLLLAASLVAFAPAALADPPDGAVPTDASAPAQPGPDEVVSAPRARQPGPDEVVSAPRARRRPRAPSDPTTLVTPRVDVVGTGARALERIPGSATLVRREDLEQLAPQNAGDVLRTVPGLNVVAEDGMGLRLNIGIRGLDPNRSRQVLVLEDGIPITLNPYGAPELYYSPPIERMERVEVVRGSGQILWGPQTVGGVINYISRDPPRRPSGGVELRYGNFGYFLSQAWAGATHGAIGWRVDALHRRFDGPRNLDLGLTDVVTRLRLQLSSRSILGVKFGIYHEDSASTYLGLTRPQYEANPAQNPASNDRFTVQRYAFSVTHQHAFTSDVMLRTNFYAYRTGRVWRRQEYDRTGALGDYDRVCDPTGACGAPGAAGVNPTRDGGSIFLRRTAAIRDRAFGVLGFEPRLTWAWRAGDRVAGELSAVVRFHTESAEDALRISNQLAVNAGTPIDDESRAGYALSAAVQNRFAFWDRLFVTPGVRVESFWSDRFITRASTVDAMGQTVTRDVDVRGSAHTVAVIPGLGVALDVARPLTLFTGVHRGYAPPRTKDAVSPSGMNLQLDPELSWNTELGARLRFGRWLSAEVAGFWLEFDNQIIPPSESGGAVSAGGFNSGHSRHIGLEASATFDLAPLVQRRGQTFSLPLTVNYTWLPTASFVGGLFDGNRLPYAPDHTLYTRLRFVHRSGFSAQVGMTFIGAQFADRENTLFGSLDGLVGELPSYLTVDARVAYAMRRTGFTFYVAGRNLTDQIYIANRAPQGIQPAGFRQVFLGLEWNLPGPAGARPN